MLRHGTLYILLMAVLMAVMEDIFHSAPEDGEGMEEVRCVVCDNPQLSTRYGREGQRVDVRCLSSDEHLRLYIWHDTTLHARNISVGDELMFRARLHTPRYYGAPGTWDYASWLRRHGISRIGNVAEQNLHNIGPSEHRNLRELMLKWRNEAAGRYAAIDDSRIEGIMAAMTLGERRRLDEEGRNIHRQAGAAHLLALSGLHLGILMGAAGFLLAPLAMLRYGKHLKCLVLLLLCWCFVVLTGMPLSIVRAATMLSICLVVDTIADRPRGFHVLALAVSIVLLCSPGALYDVGFQLSVVAVAGILTGSHLLRQFHLHKRNAPWKWQFQVYLWNTRLRAYFPKHPRMKKAFAFGKYMLQGVLNTVRVSVCCILFSQPLLSYYFGIFTPWGIPASIIAIPITTCLVILGMVYVLLPPLQMALIPMIRMLGRLQWDFLEGISQMPFSVLPAPLSAGGAAAAYMALAWLFLLPWWRRRLNLYLTFLLLPLVLCADSLYAHIMRREPGIWLTPGNRTAEVRCVSDTVVYILRADTCADARRGERDGVLQCEGPLLCFRHRTLGIAGNNFSSINIATMDMACKTDALLISENAGRPLSEYISRFHPAILVLDTHLPDTTILRLQREAAEWGIPTHALKEDGVFVLQ